MRPDRIRQDVSRSPGGDARVFLNNCIGCHSGMDPMAQAFAYYNFAVRQATDPTADAGFSSTYNDTGEIDPITGTRVVRKYFNNNTTFPIRLHHHGRSLGQLLASRSERSARLGQRIAGLRRRREVVGTGTREQRRVRRVPGRESVRKRLPACAARCGRSRSDRGRWSATFQRNGLQPANRCSLSPPSIAWATEAEKSTMKMTNQIAAAQRLALCYMP